MAKVTKKHNRTTKSKFKHAIANSLSKALCSKKEDLWDLIQIPKSQSHGQFTLPIPRLLKLCPQQDSKEMCHKISHSLRSNIYIESVKAQGQFLNFNVNREEYMKETLLSVFEEKEKYGQKTNDQSVLIHFGSDCHLRSMLIGKFIQNTYEANGYRCTTMNSFDNESNEGLGKMKHDPKTRCRETHSKDNQGITHNPENISKEAPDEKKYETVKTWNVPINFDEDCQRLDVHFGITLSKSEAKKYTDEVYKILTQKKLWELSEDSSWTVYLSEYGSKLWKATIRKADGTSTRFTRDLASIWMCRDKTSNIKKFVFVADIGQECYFRQLFKVAELMMDRPLDLELVHVAYGKTLGTSTSSVKEILDTAKNNMIRVIKEDMGHGKHLDILHEGLVVNGKPVQGENAVNYVGDTLGTSAVVTQSMAVKRVRPYNFSWDKMTDARGDTGIFLQYTHARVCGIERRQKTAITSECDFSLIDGPEAFELVYAISLYPDIIQTALETLDSCSVVLYLFKLAHMISQTNYNLRIKDVGPDLAKARLLLFWAAKTTLSNGMKLVGLCPLEKM